MPNWTLEECEKDPACDPIEELAKIGFPVNSDNKDIGDTAGRMVDRVTDLIRDHNIGGARGRELANEVDHATGRAEREANDNDNDRNRDD